MGDILAPNTDFAGAGVNKAGDRAQRSRLAAARGAQKGKEFAFLNIDVDILQSLKRTKGHFNVLEIDHDFHLTAKRF